MDPKIVKLQEVFNTMSYGENIEDTSDGQEWLDANVIKDKSDEVEELLRNWKLFDYTIQKANLIKLAQELENNKSIICQIEILSRGILSKDTKKAVEILADYFYFYASLIETGSKSKGRSVGLFEDDHPLWLLGLFLAPALAANDEVLIQTGTKFAPVVAYVVQLAIKSGIPSECLVQIPSNSGNVQPYFDIGGFTIALFVDLSEEKYNTIPYGFNKVLTFSAYKTPILVFEDADLDSAVESIVEAAWGYQGILPWSADTVLVQENIFNIFKEKLKIKLQSINIGNGTNKLADITYPSNPKVIQTLNETVAEAKALGIEVFQKEETRSENFTPTLIIGSKVHTNNVLSAPKNDGTVTLLAFRSIDEAVNLGNNSKQGLGASIWSENIGLVNEVARKLMVSNVWINSHGLFSIDLPLVPLKDSGVGYYGGQDGILEYISLEPHQTMRFEERSYKNVSSINNAIISGKHASSIWRKVCYADKIKHFLQLYDFIEENKDKLQQFLFNHQVTTEFIKSTITDVYKFRKNVGDSTRNGYSVTSHRYPKGVLLFQMYDPYDEAQPIVALLAALFEGNAVILMTTREKSMKFYQELSKKFPSGILTVLPYSVDALCTALKHEELNDSLVFGVPLDCVPLTLKDLKLYTFGCEAGNWNYIFNKVTIIKNVWSNIGQSSQCNL